MRPVWEDVAEVAAAVRAHDLGAHHPEGRVALLVDRLLFRRCVEGGPAAARVVLRLRREQLGSAPRAVVGAWVERVVVLAGEGRFGAFLLAAWMAVAASVLATPLGAGGGLPERIALPDGFRPEGIAISQNGTFYVGSIPTGAIYRGSLKTGRGEIINPGSATG